jgi:DNA polymerase IV (family X)
MHTVLPQLPTRKVVTRRNTAPDRNRDPSSSSLAPHIISACPFASKQRKTVVEEPVDRRPNRTPTALLSNAEIADRLASLAQLLSTQKENPYKVKAYYRAATRIRNLPDSLDEMVRREEDLTKFPAIGAAIASAIKEIVTTGMLAKLERLRSEATPAVAELSAHPRLDPRRVMRVYKKLKISSLDELRQRIENGEIHNFSEAAWHSTSRRASSIRTPCCSTGQTISANWLKIFCFVSAMSGARKQPVITAGASK